MTGFPQFDARLSGPQAQRPTDAVRVLVRVPRRDIALLCSLFEGYEGVAVVRTADTEEGIVALLVAPAFLSMALELLQVFAQEIALQLLSLDIPDVAKGTFCNRSRTPQNALDFSGG